MKPFYFIIIKNIISPLTLIVIIFSISIKLDIKSNIFILILLINPIITNQINSINDLKFYSITIINNFNHFLIFSNIIIALFIFLTNIYFQYSNFTTLFFSLLYLLSIGNYISLTPLSYSFRIANYPILNFFILTISITFLLKLNSVVNLILSPIFYIVGFNLTQKMDITHKHHIASLR